MISKILTFFLIPLFLLTSCGSKNFDNNLSSTNGSEVLQNKNKVKNIRSKTVSSSSGVARGYQKKAITKNQINLKKLPKDQLLKINCLKRTNDFRTCELMKKSLSNTIEKSK